MKNTNRSLFAKLPHARWIQVSFSLAFAALALAPASALANGSISISMAIPPYPSVEFSQVPVNLPPPQNHADATFTITNNGTDLLWSFNYTIDRSQFTLVSQTCGGNFYPGQTCTVTMRYTPTQAGEYWGGTMNVWFTGLAYMYPVQLLARSYTAPVVTVPGQPTIGTATAGNGSATVTFSAPASNGGSAITSYTATSSPGNVAASCTAPCSSIWVSSLIPGVAYTFTVHATNIAGASTPSFASNSVTP